MICDSLHIQRFLTPEDLKKEEHRSYQYIYTSFRENKKCKKYHMLALISTVVDCQTVGNRRWTTTAKQNTDDADYVNVENHDYGRIKECPELVSKELTYTVFFCCYV